LGETGIERFSRGPSLFSSLATPGYKSVRIVADV
jgi:hypothetical protein